MPNSMEAGPRPEHLTQISGEDQEAGQKEAEKEFERMRAYVERYLRISHKEVRGAPSQEELAAIKLELEEARSLEQEPDYQRKRAERLMARAKEPKSDREKGGFVKSTEETTHLAAFDEMVRTHDEEGMLMAYREAMQFEPLVKLYDTFEDPMIEQLVLSGRYSREDAEKARDSFDELPAGDLKKKSEESVQWIIGDMEEKLVVIDTVGRAHGEAYEKLATGVKAELKALGDWRKQKFARIQPVARRINEVHRSVVDAMTNEFVKSRPKK